MRTIRTALLVAAATLASVPALVVAQTPPEGQGWHGRGHGDDRRDDDRGPQQQARFSQQQQQQSAQQPNGEGRNFGDHDRDGRPNDRQRGDYRSGDDRRIASGGGYNRERSGDDRRGEGRFDDRRGFDRGGFGQSRFDGRDAGWRSDRRYDWQAYRNQNRGAFHGPRYDPPRGYRYGYRPFERGFRLDPFLYGRGYWIVDPHAYRLPPADGPYRWVRYYGDVLLVDVRSGTIVDVIHQFFL